jgi:hypothetical protein
MQRQEQQQKQRQLLGRFALWASLRPSAERKRLSARVYGRAKARPFRCWFLRSIGLKSGPSGDGFYDGLKPCPFDAFGTASFLVYPLGSLTISTAVGRPCVVCRREGRHLRGARRADQRRLRCRRLAQKGMFCWSGLQTLVFGWLFFDVIDYEDGGWASLFL